VGFPLENYNDCYVSVLSRMWGKTAVNVAVDGSRTSWGTYLISPTLAQYNPKYMIIYYGTNDVAYDSEYIVDYLRYIIFRAKENGTIPVVATIGPFFGEWAWRKPIAIDLNKKIRQMAAEEGVACADIEAAFNWNGAYFYDDGIHPNRAGHQIIANTFYRALTR
jgi:lysophospholipase L1-like esterase